MLPVSHGGLLKRSVSAGRLAHLLCRIEGCWLSSSLLVFVLRLFRGISLLRECFRFIRLCADADNLEG